MKIESIIKNENWQATNSGPGKKKLFLPIYRDFNLSLTIK